MRRLLTFFLAFALISGVAYASEPTTDTPTPINYEQEYLKQQERADSWMKLAKKRKGQNDRLRAKYRKERAAHRKHHRGSSGAVHVSRVSVYGGHGEAQAVASGYPGGTEAMEDNGVYYFASRSMRLGGGRNYAKGQAVRFTYKGKSVVAYCMDRGPYANGADFDLGKNTAKKIGFPWGVGNVKWQKVN